MADLRTNDMNQFFFNEYFKKIHQTASKSACLESDAQICESFGVFTEWVHIFNKLREVKHIEASSMMNVHISVETRCTDYRQPIHGSTSSINIK